MGCCQGRDHEGYQLVPDGSGTDKNKPISKVVGIFTVLIVLIVIVCLITAYAIDLGGEVKIEHVDHTPCDLKVDAGSARRISHLIHNEEIQLFYLALKFPDGVMLHETENIFRAYSMVWTFGGHPGTKHFLDLPWMYLVWSFGLLDHYTYRNVELSLIVQGNDTCSFVLGSNSTTFAIVTALRDLAIKITREGKQIDKDLMQSIWCQTYFKEGINPDFMNFAKLFRFYYSDFRYMCSHLDFNFNSNDYEVVTDVKHQRLTRRWSWLAFTLSIASLWFFPLILLYFERKSYDQENIYLEVKSPSSFGDILHSIFKDCFKSIGDCCTCVSKCKCSCKCWGLLFLMFVVCPLGIYITLIYLAVNSESSTMLSDLDKRKKARAWLSASGGQFFTSDLFPMVFYLLLTPILFIIAIAKKREKETTEFERQRSLFYAIPWLYIFWKFETIMKEFNCKHDTVFLSCLLFVFLFLLFLLFLLWVFFFLVTVFKTLMTFFMFLSFFILSVLTFPKFISSLVTYISIAGLFVIRRIYYLPNQYYKFLALNIDVMKTMKIKLRVNRKGDLGMSEELFCKLVDEHQPLRKMVLKILFELIFVVTILIWTGLWISELNQWREIIVVKDMIIGGIIYKIPDILESLFFSVDKDLLVLRLKKSIPKFFAEISLKETSKAIDGIKETHEGIKQAYQAFEQDANKQVRIGINKAITGINKTWRAMEQVHSSLEHGILEMEQCFDQEIKVIEPEKASREIKQCDVCTRIKQTNSDIKECLNSIENCPIRTCGTERPLNAEAEITSTTTVTIDREQIPEVKVGLQQVCDRLHKALERLKHTFGELKRVHDKQDPPLNYDETEQVTESGKEVLTGLHQTINILKQARSIIEKVCREFRGNPGN